MVWGRYGFVLPGSEEETVEARVQPVSFVVGEPAWPAAAFARSAGPVPEEFSGPPSQRSASEIGPGGCLSHLAIHLPERHTSASPPSGGKADSRRPPW